MKIERIDNVQVLKMDEPHRRNPISARMMGELESAVEKACADPEIRAIVLTGEGDAFSAGGDFADMKDRDLLGWRAHFEIIHRHFRALVRAPKPVYAAVEGWAVGAGLSLALGCDTIVAAETSKFMYAFNRMGLIADMGMWFTLPRRIGEAKARQWFLHGGEVDAAKACTLGLVDRIAPAGRALEVAVQIAQSHAGDAPLPIAVTKMYLAEGLDQALDRELDLATPLFRSDDHREARAAFA